MIPANSRTLRHRPLIIALLMLCASVLACNAPGREADPTAAPAEPSAAPVQERPTILPATQTPAPDVIYEGTSFSYDASLASHVEATKIPAVDTPDGPQWEVTPAHLQFTFTGYALPDRFHKAHILVYPVSEYEALSAVAATVISDLRRLLADRPAAPDTIPFLPTWNAAQMIRTQILYLDFQNGTGVRFLTQYGQAASPINNYELFYAFQGITADGAYYVAAILPVSSPLLPADPTTIPGGGDYDAFVEQYATYLDDVAAQLEAQPAAEFTPDLELLDQIIASLKAT